jgi:hypothetical protein
VYGKETFTACALFIFGLVELILERSGLSNSDVAYVFEKGDREHEMHSAFSWHESHNPHLKDKRSISFLPKSTTLLQPADLIAGKIQEILIRGHSLIGTLDNGMQVTPVQNFDKYYSFDGTSASVMRSIPIRHSCWIANKPLFHTLDGNLKLLGVPSGVPYPLRIHARMKP